MEISAAPSALRRAFDFQIAACEGFGSAFSAEVLRIVADDIDAGGPFAVLAGAWTDWSVRELTEAAAPIRLLGGLHYLVLSGAAPDLAAEYPTARPQPDREALRARIVDAGHVHAEVLAGFAGSPPQTNEVRRSLCLIGGFLTVARETGLPLRCLEIGASAGLNLNWDRYRYDLGASGAWGDPRSPVRLDGAWSGQAPPFDTVAVVAERVGCDRAPVDVSDPDQALRLAAYVWADQPDRLARVRAAIGVARRHRPQLETADAGDWALRIARPQAGLASVLYHSVVWQYLAAETRAAVREAIRIAAGAARPDAPFAWLRMEPSTSDPAGAFELRLNLWPGGAERCLAHVHPHGAKVLWLGA
jgi:hypothetical protein